MMTLKCPDRMLFAPPIKDERDAEYNVIEFTYVEFIWKMCTQLKVFR